MSRFTILLGGEITRTPRLDRQLTGTRVIAADSGIRHAAMLGLSPELWTGDFDSVSDEMRVAHNDVPTEIFPPEKDKTDGEIAIDAALQRGATDLLLAGAFGGARADHAFLHLTAAIELAERGLSVVLTSGRQEGHPLLPGRHTFDYVPGTLFSVLCFDAVAGLSLEGAKWPLNERDVPFGSSLTLSNETQNPLVVSLRAGRALLLAHPYPDL